jgi:hypothetical protein
VNAVSASFVGAGGVFCQRSDSSYQYKLADTVSGRTWGLAILAAGSFTLDDVTGGTSRLAIDTIGTVALTGPIKATGHACRGGTAGAYTGNNFNIQQGAAQFLWIDTTNAGQLAYVSDYRVKKDVIDLPGMWDTVKALRPIKYTQAQFSPPSHVKYIAEEALKARKEAEENPEAKPREVNTAPLYPADDIERWGFIAHELQATLTESAASGVKDSPDTIQSPNPFTVIAALTKALQEAMARIEALEGAVPTQHRGAR